MKNLARILAVLLLVVMLAAVGGFMYIKNMKLPEVSIDDVKLSSISDGTYKGDYSAGLVSAAVTVVVKDNKITGIVINKHENGLGKKAEKIVYDIIDKQSLNIDNISGATLSSNVIRKAVEQALEKQSVGTGN